MKIGTDSVLLGAWTSLKQKPSKILDIGAGTGILSLMLAQRQPEAFIEALEIDGNAYEQCVENFENSDWSDRMFCYHASILEYVEEVDERYDLIISNPPFYSNTYKTYNEQRNKARFQDALPFEHLLYAVNTLLSEAGVFSIVLPYSEEANFVRLAKAYQLFPIRLLNVKGHANASIKRSLIEFCRTEQKVKPSTLVIETSRHNYTKGYIDLTKDFYLKM